MDGVWRRELCSRCPVGITHNKANSRGQIFTTFVCAINSTSLALLPFAGDLRRYRAGQSPAYLTG